MNRATHENATVSLPATCILVRRDGYEYPIEESAAPIQSLGGAVGGAVMVFRDVSAARDSPRGHPARGQSVSP
jgi:hypothetical protein